MAFCPVCNFKNDQVYMSFRGYSYRKCSKCSLVFLGNGIIPLEDKVLYAYDYIQRRGYDIPDSYVAKAKEATAVHYLSFLEKYVSKKNLLEVGCATGITLKVARDRGWSVYGAEINEAAASIARKLLHTETIKTGYLDEEVFPDNFFSAVLMFDVLEHIHNPLKLMVNLRKKLKPEGFLFLLTPNINSLSAKILKGKWPHLFLEHVCLYSPESVKFLLNKYHFKILKIGWANKFVNLDVIRHHLECHPDILLSKSALAFLNNLPALKKIIFPLNVGEIYILAQNNE